MVSPGSIPPLCHESVVFPDSLIVKLGSSIGPRQPLQFLEYFSTRQILSRSRTHAVGIVRTMHVLRATWTKLLLSAVVIGVAVLFPRLSPTCLFPVQGAVPASASELARH